MVDDSDKNSKYDKCLVYIMYIYWKFVIFGIFSTVVDHYQTIQVVSWFEDAFDTV